MQILMAHGRRPVHGLYCDRAIPSQESQAVAKEIFKHWNRWASPKDVLVCDGDRGLGASEAFTVRLPVSGTQVQTKSAYSRWQKGQVEKTISSIKVVSSKVAKRSALSTR